MNTRDKGWSAKATYKFYEPETGVNLAAYNMLDALPEEIEARLNILLPDGWVIQWADSDDLPGVGWVFDASATIERGGDILAVVQPYFDREGLADRRARHGVKLSLGKTVTKLSEKLRK